jgi:uncharacterized membrane protein
MKCDKCGSPQPEEELHQSGGDRLCDDCMMNMLSPAKACDPWAVKAATSSIKSAADAVAELRGNEKKVYELIKETGGVDLEDIPKRVGASPKEVERALSVLRHMELLRASMREDRGKRIVLFDS